ncbi:hypothetical protein KIPB_014231, partial [Kipferlia bialata]|eukprot:g14231.t1
MFTEVVSMTEGSPDKSRIKRKTVRRQIIGQGEICSVLVLSDSASGQGQAANRNYFKFRHMKPTQTDTYGGTIDVCMGYRYTTPIPISTLRQYRTNPPPPPPPPPPPSSFFY